MDLNAFQAISMILLFVFICLYFFASQKKNNNWYKNVGIIIMMTQSGLLWTSFLLSPMISVNAEYYGTAVFGGILIAIALFCFIFGVIFLFDCNIASNDGTKDSFYKTSMTLFFIQAVLLWFNVFLTFAAVTPIT